MGNPQNQGKATEPSATTRQARQVTGAWHPGSMLAALAVFLVGAVSGAGFMYFGLERPALDAAQSRAQTYEQDLAALRGRLELANNAAAALEGRLLVEESTRRGLETGLQAMQTELGAARDSLAFYEQLMPPGPQGAISIRALDIERVGPHLRYRLLLMRSGNNDKAFQGNLQFLAKGLLNGEAATVTLLPTTLPVSSENETDTSAGLMAVELTDFQRDSGLLSLPAGFVPESLTVNVLEGRTLRTSRNVELPPVANLP